MVGYNLQVFIVDYIQIRARIFKLLRSTRIDSIEPIPPSCVSWPTGTTSLFLLGF